MTRLNQISIKAALLTLLIPLSAAVSQAGVVYVSSITDSGTGSLRSAITTANLTPGATINWTTTGAGTLTLLSNLPSINGNTTLDVTGAVNDVTITASTNSMAIGGPVTFTNDSLVSTWTINEDITGAGSLVKTGDGLLVLTGTNTYTGGTSINGGTISTDGDDSLGALSARLSFNGGTLAITDDITSDRAVTLNSGGGTFNTNSSTLTLSGFIVGAGALHKTGDGEIILIATNSYTGGTFIDSGTLLIGADNAIPSTGPVTLSAYGTLDLGDHTQKIETYSGSGNLALLLQNGVTNLTITSTADFAGGSLLVTYTPQIIYSSDTFTPITYSTCTGEFANIISPAAIAFTPTYNSGSLVLTPTLVPFESLGATANQRAVGAALDPLRATPAGDFATVLGDLYTLDAAAIRSALDQMSPVSLSAIRGLALSGSSLHSAAIEARAQDLAAGNGGGFSSYRADGEHEGSFDTVSYDEAVKSVKHNSGGSAGPWGLFAAAGGLTGKVIETGTAGENTPGYKFYGGAVTAGADYSLGEHMAAGLLAGYNIGHASLQLPSGGSVDSHSVRYGAYAAGSVGALRLNVYAGRADDNFDTERQITFDAVSRKATASPTGKELNLEADAAYEISAITTTGVMAPFVRANYDRLETDAFTETGADSLNLSVGAVTANSMRSAAGFRYYDSVDAGGGAIVKTTLSVAWSHEYRDQNLPLTASLEAGGSPFTVTSGNTSRDALKFGTRVMARSETGVISGWLDYSGDLRKQYYAHAVTAAVALKF